MPYHQRHVHGRQKLTPHIPIQGPIFSNPTFHPSSKQSNQQKLRSVYESALNNPITYRRSSKNELYSTNRKKQPSPLPLANIDKDQTKNQSKYRLYLEKSNIDMPSFSKDKRYRKRDERSRKNPLDLSLGRQSQKRSDSLHLPKKGNRRYVQQNGASFAEATHQQGKQSGRNPGARVNFRDQYKSHDRYGRSSEKQQLSERYSRAVSHIEEASVLTRKSQALNVRRNAKKSLSGSLIKEIPKKVRGDSNLSKEDRADQPKAGHETNKMSSKLQLTKRLKHNLDATEQTNEIYEGAVKELKSQNFEEALKLLDQIISREPNFKRAVYQFAAISSRRINRTEKSISYLTQGLRMFPDSIDLLFYRGKCQKEVGNDEAALEDFERVVRFQADHVQALYYLSMLYRKKKSLTHSISTLSSALYHENGKQSEIEASMLKLRAQMFMEQGSLLQARKDIEALSRFQEEQLPSVSFLRGILDEKLGNHSSALIYFEKCIRQQSSADNTFEQENQQSLKSKALIEIAKINITIKDFYSAYHSLNRWSTIAPGQLKSKTLTQYTYFVQGVIFLMKRKIDEALHNFDKFISHIEGTIDSHPFFSPMFYLYRAFGYFMANQHQKAVIDYEQYERHCTLDKHTLYNLFLAKGITKIKAEQFQEAESCFNKAEVLFKENQPKIEPYIYRAISLVQKAKILQGSSKQSPMQKSNSFIENNSLTGSQKMDDEIKILELVFEGLKQLDKAYDLNENNSNLLYIRSLVYSYLKKNNEALEDVIKAISKSEQNVPKYFFFRAMLQQTLQNQKQAVNDFNICLNLDSNFQAAYLERAKLYFSLQNYSKGLEDLEKLQEINPNQKVLLHKACLYYTNGLYPMAEEAADLIKSVSEQIDESSLLESLHFHAKLKMMKLSEVEELCSPENIGDKVLISILKNCMQFCIESEDRVQEHKEFPQLENEAMESMINFQSCDIRHFNIIQYHHILGVYNFYRKEYSQALTEFTIALKECNLRDLEKDVSKKTIGDNVTERTGNKDMNCINYNIFLTHLQLRDLRKTYEVFIRDLMPAAEEIVKPEFLGNFSHLLFTAMKTQNKNQIPDEDKQSAHVQLFNNAFTDSLSSLTSIELPNFKLVNLNSDYFQKTKLCMLNIFSEQIQETYSPCIYPGFVLKRLNAHEVENRPQPPWVKRQSSQSSEGLVFTSQVRDIKIEFLTTQQDEEDEEYDDEENEENDADGEENSENESNDSEEADEDSLLEEPEKFDPRKFKERMKLGDQIERKLNKMVKKPAAEF